MTRQEFIRKDMAWCSGQMQKRLAKYRRNFNRYCNNGRRSEDVRELYGNPLSFYNLEAAEDTGATPNINIIRSAIDTHVSKLSELKVRPFFNPLVGTFKTRKVCRNAQAYFDEFFDSQDVYRKSIQAVRYADVFEMGCLWVEDETRTIHRLPPWEFFFDPAEWHYGKLSRCFVLQKQYPLVYLKDKIKKFPDLARKLEEDRAAKCERVVYYDLIEKRKYLVVDTVFVDEQEIDYTCSPVAVLFREEPLKSSFAVSMADDLYTVQAQIDSLCMRIHLALELTPANTTWIPQGSDIKASMISNEIGQVFQYRPVPGADSGVFVSTPRAIDPQYVSMLEFWIRTAYELMGISQLSAQAKKPSGLNSGVALQTVEDVESERHNPILQGYIRLLMDTAKISIEVFPQGEEILPKRSGRANVKWADIRRERESFAIQFSASSSLSKDPKVKMEQIEKLISMKVINPALAAQLLEFPDLEGAYSITTASYDYCQKIIERAVEDGIYDFYEVVSLEQLFGEAVNTLLRLDANEEDHRVLERLVELIKIVKGKMDGVNATIAPPEPMPPAAPQQLAPIEPPQAPGPTGPLPIEGPPPQPLPMAQEPVPIA